MGRSVNLMNRIININNYLYLLEFLAKEINFVLFFYEGTSKQEFVEEEWNEICSLQDAKVRAEKKLSFSKHTKFRFLQKFRSSLKNCMT